MLSATSIVDHPQISTFIAVFVISYWWHMMGVTIGYHRLLSHRSFRCPKLVEYFWVLGGYLAFEGSPIWWAAIHRAHHRYVDQPRDPHSPRQRGWKYAYIGWIKEPGYPDYINPPRQAKDLLKDQLYAWLEQGGDWRKAHRLSAKINLAFRCLLWLSCGWIVMVANFAAALIVQQIPLMLNVICHIPKLGYKNYPTPDDSVNVWWVAVLTAGEGWHNNHHAFPGSARSGLKPHEIDPSWLMLLMMKMFGLVSWMHEESVRSKYRQPHEAVEG
ncbi:MAG: acyl-CoA desaturase [Candidatus Obscuribacterales bacterium]|nr:acyl-CoA desaturase [Candidatus Obscuribacterales bacterium]